MTLREVQPQDQVVITDEVDAGATEGRVEQHIGLRGLTPAAVLAIVELGKREGVL